MSDYYKERDKQIIKKFEELKVLRPNEKLKVFKEELADEFCMSSAQLEKVIYRKEKGSQLPPDELDGLQNQN
jgi:hypothetical protein